MDAYTIDQFCASHSVSKLGLYKLWEEGRGPRRMEVGPRKVLISKEAAAEWRARMETERPDRVAATEQSRAAAARHSAKAKARREAKAKAIARRAPRGQR